VVKHACLLRGRLIANVAMSFAVYQRVRVKESAFEFGGVVGTIAIPPEGIASIDPVTWIGPFKYQRRPEGTVIVYWVRFDEPADDGSGDGPYWGCEIAEEDLVPISADA
jgi:hypothetical protein